MKNIYASIWTENTPRTKWDQAARNFFFKYTFLYCLFVCLFVCLFATNINFIIKVLNKEEKSLKSSRSLPSTGESTHPSFLHGWPRCLSKSVHPKGPLCPRHLFIFPPTSCMTCQHQEPSSYEFYFQFQGKHFPFNLNKYSKQLQIASCAKPQTKHVGEEK